MIMNVLLLLQLIIILLLIVVVGDDDPHHGAQPQPGARDRAAPRLGHCGLRGPVLRPRGYAIHTTNIYLDILYYPILSYPILYCTILYMYIYMYTHY